MSGRQLVLTGLVLTVLVVALGSVRFARYDWTGLPLARTPAVDERQVSDDCLEELGSYSTESGRIISPVNVDEEQYMSLVQHYRGVPIEDLQVTCFYDPFTNRSGMSWVAHLLPFEEGLALGVTNLSAMVLATWFVIAAIRAQGFSARAVVVAATLFAVGWNTFYFSSAILVDTGVLALIAIGWWLLATARPWFLLPILLFGYPVKETVGILVPVVASWAWQECRAGRRSVRGAVALTLASAVCFVAGVAYWRGALPEPAAAWEVTPGIQDTIHNLTDVISLGSFAIGVVPLFLPAALEYGGRIRREGWLAATVSPEVIGCLLTVGISGWSFITVDLTPRLMWMGFPFAATLTASWLSRSGPAEVLERLPMPRALVGEGAPA